MVTCSFLHSLLSGVKVAHGEGKWGTRKGPAALGILPKSFNECCSMEMLISSFPRLTPALPQQVSTAMPSRKRGKEVIWGGFSQSGRRDESLLRKQEWESCGVQIGAETDRCEKELCRGVWRGKDQSEEWEEGCYKISGPALIAEQGSAVYRWLFWVDLNLWI